MGRCQRENVTYKQIPQSTIDAFLAIEDSRYFSHNGFDLPRFISSALFNVSPEALHRRFHTDHADHRQLHHEAGRGKGRKRGQDIFRVGKVERKVQEIYMSMSLEKDLSKEEIITKYLNEINFGDSARGIQKGAEYYFGKNVEELNLTEVPFWPVSSTHQTAIIPTVATTRAPVITSISMRVSVEMKH